MYRRTSSDVVIRISDGTLIPADERNADWRAYQAWLAQGNAPESAASPAPPPILKRKQVMVQLDADGKLNAAFSAVQQAGGLIYQRWFSDDWHLADLQEQPFASMISALSIDLPIFWASAAQRPV